MCSDFCHSKKWIKCYDLYRKNQCTCARLCSIPNPLFLNQHRKYLWVHICTRNCRCFDLTSKSRPWIAFLWSRQCFWSLTGHLSGQASAWPWLFPPDTCPSDHKTRKELQGNLLWASDPPTPVAILGMMRSRIWTDGPSCFSNFSLSITWHARCSFILGSFFLSLNSCRAAVLI